MKKILPKILIGVIMVSFFLAPVNPLFQYKNNQITMKVKVNNAYAENWWFSWHSNATGGIEQNFATQELCTTASTARDDQPNTDITTPCTSGPIPQAMLDQVNSGFNAPAPEINDTEHSYSLDCGTGFWWLGGGSIGGCIAGILYIIWELVASLARLAGQFLDFFVYYSTNSSSYKSDFVEQGWAVVRDVANLFFIVALLYVAIKTILSMHDAHTKKMVGTIIVVALLINFSLFTTKVVIDASNILAKIFYNNIVPVNQNGVVQPEDEGEKSISVNIINKYNPQQIISKTIYNQEGGGAMFIFTTFVLIIMTVYTAYIFFSVAMLFVARVISLWISMIFSPIAFASNTLPFNIGSLGFSKWSEELLKNAFLAPLFIFFLYIIALFLNIQNSLITYSADVANVTATAALFQKMMHVLIPLLITLGLLTKAKTLAVEYSGEMGQNITKIGAAVGGLALGGAALGTAFAGRQTVGRFMKSASLSEEAKKYGDPALRGTLSGWGKFKGWAGHNINENQTKVQDSSHARHTLDKVAGEKFDGKKFGDLTATERDSVRQAISRDHQAEATHGKKYSQLTGLEKMALNTTLQPLLDAKTSHADTLITRSKEKQGVVSSLVQSSRTGSFDVRNLSTVTATAGDTVGNKIASGLTSMIGNSIRNGIKNSIGAQYGTGQKDFFKDLGHTLSEALKSAKITVDLSNVGKVEKESHGGGGHH